MTKRELVIQVATQLGMTQNEVADVIQSMFDTVTETLVNGDRLEIRNFGVFEVKSRDARVGRNPRTGEEVPIPEKRVASFKPGKVLKDWVQHGDEARPESLFKGESVDDNAKRNGHSTPKEDVPKSPPLADKTAPHADETSGDQQSLF